MQAGPLDYKTVGDVPPRRFTWPDDLDNLSSLETEVSCHWVSGLYPHQMVLLELVSCKKLCLFLWSEHNVFRNQLVFRYVDEQFRFKEVLKNIFRCHVPQCLFGRWGHSLLDDNYGSGNVFLLHSLAVSLDRLYADLGLIREEYEHLVCGIVVVSNKNDKITPCWPFLTWFVPKLLLELVLSLVQLILGNKVTPVVAQLHYSFTHSPEFICLSFVIHVCENCTRRHL